MSSPITQMQSFVPMTTQKISQMSGFMSLDNTQTHRGSFEDRSNFSLLEDNMGELDIVDTRKFSAQTSNSRETYVMEEIPTKLSGTYNEEHIL